MPSCACAHRALAQVGTGEPIESETSNGSDGPAGATLTLPGKQEALIEVSTRILGRGAAPFPAFPYS